MATTTPNFGWSVPTSTDLVKDGATAIELLGDSIDTTLVDLKGGTTGQVLAKTSGTDMDFTWVTTDDTNAIQNAIVDAKGDLISATAADTPARLAVGANGTVLTADSSTSTGLKWAAGGASGLVPITPTSIAVSTGTATSAGNGQVTFTTAGSVSLNGVFSATYTNYLVVFNSTHSTNATIDARLRVSGTDTTANYFYNIIDYYSNSAVVDLAQGSATSSINIQDSGNTKKGFNMNVLNPFVADVTFLNTTFNGFKPATPRQEATFNFGSQSGATSFDGITILPSTGTMTGTISVYGLAI